MRLSKLFYMLSIGIGWGAPLIMLVFAVGENGWAGIELDDAGTIFLLEVPILFGSVVMLRLWYRMWSAIQDGETRTKPGTAIGLLFIPVFNVYWIFRVVVGWVHEYNAYASRRSLAVPKLLVDLNVLYAILVLVAGPVVLISAGSAPPLGLVALAAQFFVALLLVAKICKAVNLLAIPRTTSVSSASATA